MTDPKIIRGKDVVIGHNGKTVACARSVTFVTSTSMIETTTVGDGKNATFRPQKNSTTGSMEGVISLNNDQKYTLPALRQAQLNHMLFDNATILRTSLDGLSTYKDTFDFYITSVTDTGAVGDFNTFLIDFQVTGEIAIEVV